MRYLKGMLGWGVIIYAAMYLLWSGLSIYNVADGYESLALRLIALAVLTWIAASSVRATSLHDLVPFTISWAVIAAALDAIYLVPFSGWALYSVWSVWVGYTLVAALPILMTLFRTRFKALPRA